eukprot:jgi/Ulvmu1/845/UM010_0219.1
MPDDMETKVVLSLRAADADEDAAVTVRAGEATSAVSVDAISRSRLFKDLIQQAECASDIAVPIEAAVMLEWLRHVQGTPSATAPQADRSGTMNVESMKQLLRASDVLIDETTKHAMCKRLAAEVASAQAAARDTPAAALSTCTAIAAAQVLAGLSQDLTLAVLKLVPLPTCLAVLPPVLHPAALTAHVPSMDAGSTLTLPPLPMHLLPSATAATAAFPHLRSLSLSGHVLAPHEASLTRVLRALAALTALCLADCGLRAASGRALAAALPHLPRLQSLDLSYNRLPRRAFQAVCSSLHALSVLRTLRLDGTIAFDAPDHMHALQHAVRHVPSLAEFSLGSLITQQATAWSSPFIDNLTELLCALCTVPELTSLDLHLGHGAYFVDATEIAALWETVGLLQRLRRLSLALPVFKTTPRWAEFIVWEPALGRGLGALTQLTEFVLWMPRGHTTAQPPCVAAAVAPLTALTVLRRLQLPSYALLYGLVRWPRSRFALQGVLCLPQLTRLHLHTDPRSAFGSTWAGMWCNAIPPDEDVVGMLRAATQLRSLKMPLLCFSADTGRGIPAALLAMRDGAGPGAEGGHGPRLDNLTLHLVCDAYLDVGYPGPQQEGLLAPFVSVLRAADCLELPTHLPHFVRPLQTALNAGMLRGVTRLWLSAPTNHSIGAHAIYTTIVSQLSKLPALRELLVRVPSTPPGDPSTVGALPTATLPALCTQLPALTALTSLAVRLELEGFDELVAACAAHSGLMHLDITTNERLCSSLPVGALRTLRSLIIHNAGIAAAEKFWAELPQLAALRMLGIHGMLTVERLFQLAEIATEALPALRELQVTGVPRDLCCVLSQEDLPCMFVCTP